MEWMKSGHTAVITGGASGIGFAAAARYAAAGMNVVLLDRNDDALAKAAEALAGQTAGGAEILTEVCDVSDGAAMKAVAGRVFARFGAVHCVMNNAGIGFPAGAPWDDDAALETTLSVNLWGIVNGCRAFIPPMLEHGAPGAVINTGSKQGITKPPGNFAYNLSKAGVLAYTESLAHAFRQIDDCPLTAHLLVPGFVYTSMISRFIPEQPPGAWTADQTVAFMLERLSEGDFYILCPDNDVTREIDAKRIQWSADDLIRNRPALSRWHPDYKDAFEAFMKDS